MTHSMYSLCHADGKSAENARIFHAQTETKGVPARRAAEVLSHTNRGLPCRNNFLKELIAARDKKASRKKEPPTRMERVEGRDSCDALIIRMSSCESIGVPGGCRFTPFVQTALAGPNLAICTSGRPLASPPARGTATRGHTYSGTLAASRFRFPAAFWLLPFVHL